ncbi:MAG: hypothetical protein ACR9NN_01295 [Nostochopsis sp.]
MKHYILSLNYLPECDGIRVASHRKTPTAGDRLRVYRSVIYLQRCDRLLNWGMRRRIDRRRHCFFMGERSL